MMMIRRFFSVKIYTNSSCINNGKPHARGGIGVYFPSNEYPNVSLTYSTRQLLLPPTNQRCELVAINYSMIIHWLHFRDQQCVIHTNSEYAVDSLTKYCNVWFQNGWKRTNGDPVKNADLLKPMHTLFVKNGNIQFHLIKSPCTTIFDRHTCNHNVAYALARKGLGFRS